MSNHELLLLSLGAAIGAQLTLIAHVLLSLHRERRTETA